MSGAVMLKPVGVQSLTVANLYIKNNVGQKQFLSSAVHDLLPICRSCFVELLKEIFGVL